MFTLRPESGIPIYRQLVEQIRRLIAGGQLPPGTQLPSVRDLALEHAVNPMTVSKAYALLESQGLLERNRGKPMTVAARRRRMDTLATRQRELEPKARDLALSAQQLELTQAELQQLLVKVWGASDDY